MIDKSITLIITILSLILGFWVLFNNRRSKTHRNFFLSVVFLVIWLNLIYLSHSIGLLSLRPEALSMLLIWAERLSFMSLSLFFIFAYRFVRFFPKKDKKYIKLDKFYIGFWILLAYITTTPWMIKQASFLENGSKLIIKDFLIYLWILGAVVSVIWLIYRLLEKKTKYVLLGALITAILNIAFIYDVLIGNVSDVLLQSMGVYSIIFLIGFAGFSLLKNELLKSRFIINLLLAGIFLILGIISFNNLILFVGYLIIAGILVLYSFYEKKQKKVLEEKVIDEQKRIQDSKIVLQQQFKEASEKNKKLEKRVEELERWKKLTQGREKLLDELKKQASEK